MAEIPDVIRVRKVGNDYSFTVDGEEFPWHVSTDGFQVQVGNDTMPGVTFTLLADRVEIEHDLNPAKSG